MTETKKMRSPNFPAYPLERCIELVKTLREKYMLNPVPYEVALRSGLNLSPKSSGGLQVTAALTAYGLIEVMGSGINKKIKVSELAYKIIEDNRPISPERDEVIKEAALKPAFFTKIREEYPTTLPDADALAHDLKFKFKFNPNSVNSFIGAFMKTMDFAKVYESGIIDEETIKNEELHKMIPNTDKNIPSGGAGKIVAPLPKVSGTGTIIGASEHEIANYPIKGGTIRLLASGPVTQKAIDKLIALLNISKEDFPENDIEKDTPTETE